MRPRVSILISTHNRSDLFRRTLWAIAHRCPSPPICFELVVVDDGSTENILGLLKSYSASFPWTFIRFDSQEFEKKTGIRKWSNNPCVTNNIAFRHSRGELIVQQGQEVIPWGSCYDQLLGEIPYGNYWMVMSTTFDLPAQILENLDQYGNNLTDAAVDFCERWPLQSIQYRSDVTNYLSLAPRTLWEELGGYDERYFGGISAEDSDFVRRARLIPGFTQVVSEAVSLHQYHGGKTCYYNPKPSVITPERYAEGVQNNRTVFENWDFQMKNQQNWPWGTYGVQEVISNGY